MVTCGRRPRRSQTKEPPVNPGRFKECADRSFGAYQKPPVDVVLRFGANVEQDAAAFLFHPSQSLLRNDDRSLTVSFRAGGLDEMCWHLFTWGRKCFD